MRTVFADSWYFVALLNPRDAGHPKAVAFTNSWSGRLVTTPWVLTELANTMSGSAPGRTEFLSTLEELRVDPDALIVPGDDNLWERGRVLYEQRPDKQWSLTDCISFVVMQERGITDALTADHHFEQAGFVAILK
jgi:uncharacterized protein